jgi:hypothetical protein
MRAHERHAPVRVRGGVPLPELRDIRARQARMILQPLPALRRVRRAGLSQRTVQALQELLEHAAPRGRRTQHPREEYPAGAHELRFARRRRTQFRHLQLRRPEHPREPHSRDDRERGIQSPVAVELGRIICCTEPLVLVVKYDRAARAHRRADQVRQQARVVGRTEGAIGKERAECAHEDGARTFRPDPESVRARLTLVREREREAIARYRHGARAWQVVGEGERPRHPGEVGMWAVR